MTGCSVLGVVQTSAETGLLSLSFEAEASFRVLRVVLSSEVEPTEGSSGLEYLDGGRQSSTRTLIDSINTMILLL